MWNRRQMLSGLGAAALAAACKRVAGPAKEAPAMAPMPPKPPPPGPRDLPDPGFEPPVWGRGRLVLDGDTVIELGKDGLVGRDASLAESWRIAMPSAKDFAVLRDHSVIVLDGKDRAVSRVVAGKIVATHPSDADLVRPAAAGSYWAVSQIAERVDVMSAKKTASVVLPDNTYAATAVAASDGALCISNLHGILRIDRDVETFAWDEQASHLGPGPAANQVWAAREPRIALLELAGGKATETAHFALAQGENLLHFAGSGDHAAAIVGTTSAPHHAACTVIVYDARGEKWRATFGEYRSCTAALSATKVAVAATGSTAGLLRVWDLASGKQLASSERTP